jgi:hypothetical protein
MTQKTARTLRFTLLGIGIALLAVNLAGMMEWIPKFAPPRSVNLIVITLVIASSALRRRSREQDPPAKV